MTPADGLRLRSLSRSGLAAGNVPRVIKICAGPRCGKRFEARSSRARFCSTSCRVRAHRAPGWSPDAPPRPRIRSEVAKYARLELIEAGQLTSADGRAAMALAEAIDAGAESESGAALASMIRTLAATMRRALATPEPDPVAEAAGRRRADELAARRRARR